MFTMGRPPHIATGPYPPFSSGWTRERRWRVARLAAAFDALLERGEPGQAYNIGSGDEVSIRDVIQQIVDISGQQVALKVTSSRQRPTDVPRVRADVTKIAEHTGWKPRIDLRSSLEAMWGGDAS